MSTHTATAPRFTTPRFTTTAAAHRRAVAHVAGRESDRSALADTALVFNVVANVVAEREADQHVLLDMAGLIQLTHQLKARYSVHESRYLSAISAGHTRIAKIHAEYAAEIAQVLTNHCNVSVGQVAMTRAMVPAHA